jgi:site-specific DNA-methyltransferase (adenine-specific)
MPDVLQNLLKDGIAPYYSTETEMLLLGDTFDLLKAIPPLSVDMIFADPPYFLSNNGITCHSGKMVSVNKGNWDKITSSTDKHEFNRRWLRLCKNVLTPNGTIWISGTLHNIYSIGYALEQEDFKILNNITWQKTNPPPNLACKCFTHSTETIIWAQKKDANAQPVFHYQLMKELNGGKQMKDVWSGPTTPLSEKCHGKHPTQKPLYLLERIISASTNEGQLILDPFCGSSTTGVAAKRLKRRYIGIDNSQEYLALSELRLKHENYLF